MTTPLDNVCCARIARGTLACLAELRCRPDVEVIDAGAHLRLCWPTGAGDVLLEVLPVSGVALYMRRDGHWYRHGSRLPAQGPPAVLPRQRLDQLLFPEPLRHTEPVAGELHPVRLRLVRDDRPRPVTGMETTVGALKRWADDATAARIESLRGGRSGERVIVLGSGLPLLPEARRFWGQRLLVPTGFQPDPALAESSLCEALRLGTTGIAVLTDAGVEVLPVAAFQQLSRADIRLAAQEEAS